MNNVQSSGAQKVHNIESVLTEYSDTESALNQSGVPGE